MGGCIVVSELYAYSKSANVQIYVLAVALLHLIFGIWFLKGKQSTEFARASTVTRLVIAGLFASGLGFLWATKSHDTSTMLYLGVQALADLSASLVTWRLLRQVQQKPAATKGAMTLEYYNRFLFALYMIGLAVWISAQPASFVECFHLPAPAMGADGFQPGALQVFALLLVQLALFNLVAVHHRIQPLIEAGMRGGMFTCVFVLVLVVLRVVHPVVLLLPAVDLVSVVVIFAVRVYRRAMSPAAGR